MLGLVGTAEIDLGPSKIIEGLYPQPECLIYLTWEELEAEIGAIGNHKRYTNPKETSSVRRGYPIAIVSAQLRMRYGDQV